MDVLKNNWVEVCKENNRVVMPYSQNLYYFRQSDLEKRYQKYGANCIIYFGILHRVCIFMLACSAFVAAPLLFFNIFYSQQLCTQSVECLAFKLFYTVSLFNVGNHSQFLRVQAYIWLVVAVCICIYSIYLRIYIMTTHKRINNRFDTQADFSIMLRNVSEGISDESIQKFINQTLFSELKKYYQHNLKKTINIQNKQLIQRDIDQTVTNLLKIRYIVRPRKMKNVYNKIKNRLQKLKKVEKSERLRIIHKDSLGQNKYKRINFKFGNFSQIVIIVFQNNKVKDLIHQITNAKYFQSRYRYIIPYYLFQCFFRTRRQLHIRDEQIIVNRAPQPLDIEWKYIGYTDFQSISLRVCYTIFSIIIILLNGVISYFCYKFRGQTTGEYMVVTILLVLLAQVINIILQYVLHFFVKSMKFMTISQRTKFKIIFLTWAQSFNISVFNLMIPYLAELPDVNQGITRANFPTFTIISMLVTALKIGIQYILSRLQIVRLFRRWLIKKKYVITSQLSAQYLLRGQKVPYSVKYTEWITVFQFGLIFGIMSPICIIIAVLIFCMNFFIERRHFNRTYIIPKANLIIVPLTFVNFFQLTPLWLGLAHLGFHIIIQLNNKASVQTEIVVISAIMIQVGFIFSLFPWNQILQKFGVNIYSEPYKTYDQVKHKFEITYKQSNPAQTGIDSYNIKIRQLFFDKSANQYRRFENGDGGAEVRTV